jgi:mycofactocin precursor
MAPPDVVETEATAEAAGDTAVLTDSESLVDDEVLVEEISIDGMCGVY